jgi:hypothetical protein
MITTEPKPAATRLQPRSNLRAPMDVSESVVPLRSGRPGTSTHPCSCPGANTPARPAAAERVATIIGGS